LLLRGKREMRFGAIDDFLVMEWLLSLTSSTKIMITWVLWSSFTFLCGKQEHQFEHLGDSRLFLSHESAVGYV
jgi:hypothetical protein